MIRKLIYTLALVTVAATPSVSHAQSAPSGIEPQADRLLRQMSDYLDTMGHFSVHIEESTEVVLKTGQKLQFEATVDGLVRRPDGLRTIHVGNANRQELYYDGKTTTLHDANHNYYAVIESPSTLEAAVDQAMRLFGMVAPLAEFAYRNVYRHLTEGVFSGVYVGLGTVRGVEAHHLAFQGLDVDWQIWIENGDTPVPRKFIITSKWTSGAPQFTAIFTKWDGAARVTDDDFRFTAPDGAHAVQFISAADALGLRQQ